jgi:hypothetical protein
MKWKLRLSAIGAILALLPGCDRAQHRNHPSSTVIGSGDLATEGRTVEGFTALEVGAAGHLIVEPTGLESLLVTAEDNVLPHVRTDVRNGRLVLGFEPHVSLTVTREVLYRLTVRTLTEVVASGASRVEIRGVDADDLALRLSGASFVSATGLVERLRLELSGASRAEMPSLRSRRIRADLSGASHGLVRVSDSLFVNASAVSILEYLGHPEVTANVSGGSLVRPVGD